MVTATYHPDLPIVARPSCPITFARSSSITPTISAITSPWPSKIGVTKSMIGEPVARLCTGSEMSAFFVSNARRMNGRSERSMPARPFRYGKSEAITPFASTSTSASKNFMRLGCIA